MLLNVFSFTVNITFWNIFVPYSNTAGLDVLVRELMSPNGNNGPHFPGVSWCFRFEVVTWDSLKDNRSLECSCVEELPIPPAWTLAASRSQREDGFIHKTKSTVDFFAKKNISSLRIHHSNVTLALCNATKKLCSESSIR